MGDMYNWIVALVVIQAIQLVLAWVFFDHVIKRSDATVQLLAGLVDGSQELKALVAETDWKIRELQRDVDEIRDSANELSAEVRERRERKERALAGVS